MGGNGKKGEDPHQDDGKSNKPPSRWNEDDESEDGDIASPKHDRSDDDNQPL